ncbi:hypothetical protein VNO78_15068 [Psophocarpus tetragonolobus]|uniref:Uncharacterized protein n=1 Tax=Psophocarpus tetragonolobus TaxID=3891 RepID=A0AAN9SHZ5_PSOTE
MWKMLEGFWNMQCAMKSEVVNFLVKDDGWKKSAEVGEGNGISELCEESKWNLAFGLNVAAFCVTISTRHRDNIFMRSPTCHDDY